MRRFGPFVVNDAVFGAANPAIFELPPLAGWILYDAVALPVTAWTPNLSVGVSYGGAWLGESAWITDNPWQNSAETTCGEFGDGSGAHSQMMFNTSLNEGYGVPMRLKENCPLSIYNSSGATGGETWFYLLAIPL